MNKNRIFFFVAFGIYHLAIFLFTYYVDVQKDNKDVLMGVYNYINLFKYGAFVGILLFVVDLVWSWQSVWALRKNEETMQADINSLKAKMYDLKEKVKLSTPIEPDADSDVE